jgi:peptidoglycan-associated lipoprotein
MKSRIAQSLSVAAILVTLAACSSVPLDDKSNQGAGTGTGSGTDMNAMNDPFNPQSQLYQNRSIYFDFDSYSVSDQYRPTVQMHSTYLSQHPQQRVQVQGNTDERGGTEYNLALGEKRAQAVAQQMTLSGVQQTQIETISFGKEKPKDPGHNEAAWAQNRRADIVYQR